MSARGRVLGGGVSGRTHRSAPTRWGRRSEPTENWREDGPCQRGEREWTEGGVWSPRPTGATQVMPSSGPMYLRYSFRQPNSEAEFGASVMGIGPYALRGTRDGGRHAGSSCPTGGCGEPPRLPWVAAHSGASAARVGGMGGNRSRDHPQRGHQRRTIPQSRLRRASSLYTREPLGTGDADCRVASLLAMTVLILRHSEEAQRADVGIRPFYDGRGFGPPRSSAPTEGLPKSQQTGRCGHRPLRNETKAPRDCRGSALSAERVAGQSQSLPDDLRVQHGVQRSEVSAKPRPCSRRGCGN